MSTYKQIHGTNIDVLSSDPANPVEGQVWYNSTSNTVKAFINNIGSWSTGGDLNTARYALAGAGAQTAALAFGGFISTGGTPEFFAGTESYNGTSWTELNDLNTGRRLLAGAGTQTAALGFGGVTDNPAPPPTTLRIANTESWDGTSWTEVNDLNTTRDASAGIGTQTAALAAGGQVPPVSALTESWNGTNWTEVNDLNTAKSDVSGVGTQTAALTFGGNLDTGGSPENFAGTESWNGTNWTEVNDLNFERNSLSGAGTQTAALAFGGSPPTTGLTEQWNGTSWTEVNDLNIAREGLAGAGIQTSALAFGGNTPPFTVATEEWNIGPQTITFTDS